MVYNDTKEGGCTTTVHADEPRELHEIHEPDGNPVILNEYDRRTSTNEISKVTNRKKK